LVAVTVFTHLHQCSPSSSFFFCRCLGPNIVITCSEELKDVILKFICMNLGLRWTDPLHLCLDRVDD
jgi:hypothetical protein